MSPTKLRELFAFLPVLRPGEVPGDYHAAAVVFELASGRSLFASHRVRTTRPTALEHLVHCAYHEPGEDGAIRRGTVGFVIDPGSDEWIAFFIDDLFASMHPDGTPRTDVVAPIALVPDHYAQVVVNQDTRRMETRQVGSCWRAGRNPSRREMFADVLAGRAEA